MKLDRPIDQLNGGRIEKESVEDCAALLYRGIYVFFWKRDDSSYRETVLEHHKFI
jgi:hypothetical protein